MDLAAVEKAAERKKGSEPTVRRTSNGAQHRPPECIKTRRLKRLHRSVAEQVRQQNGAALLTEAQRKHWQEAVADGLVPRLPETQSHAVEIANTAISKEAQKQQRYKAADFRKKFATWSQEALKAAALAMKAPALISPLAI